MSYSVCSDDDDDGDTILMIRMMVRWIYIYLSFNRSCLAIKCVLLYCATVVIELQSRRAIDAALQSHHFLKQWMED